MSNVIAICFIITFFVAAGILWSLLYQKRNTWGRKNASRLRIVSTLPLDPKRRLVLINRDDTQHLLLIGGPNDIVVESQIAHPKPFEGKQEVHHAIDFTPFDHRRTL